MDFYVTIYSLIPTNINRYQGGLPVCHAYLVAPVQVILPEDQILAVVYGLRNFIETIWL